MKTFHFIHTQYSIRADIFGLNVAAGTHGEECDNPVDAILDWGVQEIEQLQDRVKELESDKHINEIKAQGIADYLENDLQQYANLYDANHAVSVEHIEYSINKLRNKHE